jgi:RNA polymerase sigma factor (sigma-70 family)
VLSGARQDHATQETAGAPKAGGLTPASRTEDGRHCAGRGAFVIIEGGVLLMANYAPDPERRRAGPPLKPAVRSREEAWAIVLANQGLLWQWAHLLATPSMPAEDLASCGQVGLLRAAELWREELGAFSTIAVQWLKQAMLRARAGSGFIRLPAYVTGAERRDLERRLRPQSIGGSARADGLNFDGTAAVTLDVPDRSTEAEELAGDLARLHAALAELPERERFVIEGRLAGRTLDDLGAELGMSKEGARQIAGKAGERLREMLADDLDGEAG